MYVYKGLSVLCILKSKDGTEHLQYCNDDPSVHTCGLRFAASCFFALCFREHRPLNAHHARLHENLKIENGPLLLTTHLRTLNRPQLPLMAGSFDPHVMHNAESWSDGIKKYKAEKSRC